MLWLRMWVPMWLVTSAGGRVEKIAGARRCLLAGVRAVTVAITGTGIGGEALSEPEFGARVVG